jgi:hypothetical protein
LNLEIELDFDFSLSLTISSTPSQVSTVIPYAGNHTGVGLSHTQVLSRRWCPLWRSVPLNLVADLELFKATREHDLDDMISKVLSVHPGPARRFSVCLSVSDPYDKIEGWLSSPALDKLQELDLSYDRWFDIRDAFYLLPSSVYRFFFKPYIYIKLASRLIKNLSVPLGTLVRKRVRQKLAAVRSTTITISLKAVN